MKKISALLTCLILVMAACASPGGTQDPQSGSTGAASQETAAATEPARNEKPALVLMGGEITDYTRAAEAKKSTQVDVQTSALFASQEIPKLSNKDYTVMVYVVGSNLESRYGAATNDMNEMIASGLDFDRNNLLVYTGGSKRWTSNISNTCNSVINMQNGEELEVTAQTSETADMGAAATLAEFINYCTTNFPADHYGLVLWDHGAGPLWGYGSDELFDNDSLLFEELREAMDQTIFAGDTKLDWVGFDACLMGSVESAKLWKDYAQYLVGSEEVESGRGWDYSFLSALNETSDAREIVSSIVETYGKYYEDNKSEFFNPDVTLAAMDLSKTDALIESTNVLFTAMGQGIEEGNYAALNKARADTKAFGLSAASGKEDAYDLIDLRNLAENVGELYPEESKVVHEALDQMVVNYTSNVTGANGVSIYLPGDNIDLYGISEELYSEDTSLSQEYTDFVNSYMDAWFEGSNTDWTLGEIEHSGDELTLQLTEDQVKNASQILYTVLQRDSMGGYAITTAHVRIRPDENNVLHIPADPMLLTMETDMEEAPAPMTCVQSEDNDGECIYRTINCYITPGHEFMDVDFYKDEEVIITVRNKTGETEAAVLDITSSSGSAWAGGKASIDVSNYDSIINAGSFSLKPSRDADGNMKPFNEWESGGYEMYPLCLDNSFRIKMKPASGFNKDFICQVMIKDVNGNVHASEFTNLETGAERVYEGVSTQKGTLYAEVSGEEAVISGYEGEDEEITIPAEIAGKKVTAIGVAAFAGNETIKSFTFPDTITEIYDEAFRGITACTGMTLPGSLKTIGISAFRYSSIEEIELPAGLEVIKRAAFSRSKLKSVNLPEGIASIGSIPFGECENLSEITISGNNPNYKTSDGVLYTKDGKLLVQYPGARGGAYKVEEGTEEIGYGAFAYSAIESVVLPESLKRVANMAFFECQNLKSFNLPDALEYVGTTGFGEYGLFSFGDEENPLIESVHIGPNLKYIGNEAFNMMNVGAFEVDEANPYFASSGGFITSKAKDMIIEVPGGMGKVIVIPDGITTLQDGLLTVCDDDSDFIIPDSVFRFGERVFPYGYSDTEDENGKKAVIYKARLHCSEGSAAEEYAKLYSVEYDDITDPENLTFETVVDEIPGEGDENPYSLTWHLYKDHAELAGCDGGYGQTLTIPSTYMDLPVTALRCGGEASYGFYAGFFKVIIPDSVTKIDNEFVKEFSLLKEIEVDEDNAAYKSVDGVLFDAEGETLIRYPIEREGAEYTVPDKTETIGEYAFYMNNEITKVTFPKSLRAVKAQAFNGCNNLVTVEFNKGLKEIGYFSFNSCPLTDVQLPSTVTSIEGAAFEVSGNFGSIELPEKLEKLGYSAFQAPYDEYFTQEVITIPPRLSITDDFLERILFERYEVDEKSENYAAVDGLLMSRDGRTLVSVPTLKEGDLIIPEGTLYIDYRALDECDKVTDIYLPDSLLDVGNIAAKNYDTGEYRYVIHCRKGTESQRALDAKGVPWVEK